MVFPSAANEATPSQTTPHLGEQSERVSQLAGATIAQRIGLAAEGGGCSMTESQQKQGFDLDEIFAG